MLNTITIQGRITDDIELRRTLNGTPVASFTIACQRDVADGSGNRATDFIEVVTWNGTAEFVSKYFAKGNMTVVKGRLQMRDWEDKAGNKRRTAEIIADKIYFGESRKPNTGDSEPRGGNEKTNGACYKELTDDDGNDLPF